MLKALLTPDFGLFAWSFLACCATFLLLRYLAWDPILSAIKERETSIATALQEAKQARATVAALAATQAKLLEEAEKARAQVRQDALALKGNILAEAQLQAKKKQEELLNETRATLQQERQEALASLKKEVVNLTLVATQKLLKKELKKTEDQYELLDKLVAQIEPTYLSDVS